MLARIDLLAAIDVPAHNLICKEFTMFERTSNVAEGQMRLWCVSTCCPAIDFEAQNVKRPQPSIVVFLKVIC